MLPVGGGGGGGVGLVDGPRPIDAPPPTGGDAGIDSAIDAAKFNGRVCLVSDPRVLTQIVSATACASTGAGGFTVKLGTATATTNTDGTFTIDAPDGPAGSALFHVTGGAIVEMYMFATDFEIPAITKTQYAQMLTDSNVRLVPGEGSVIAQVVHNDAAIASVTATASPVANATLFDGSTATAWSMGSATGSFGAIWLAGLDQGDGAVALTTVYNGVTLTSAAQPVFDGAITFVDVVYQ